MNNCVEVEKSTWSNRKKTKQTDGIDIYLFPPIYHFSQSSWKTAAFYSLFYFIFGQEEMVQKPSRSSEKEKDKETECLYHCRVNVHQQANTNNHWYTKWCTNIVWRLIYAKQSLVKTDRQMLHLKVGGIRHEQCILNEMIKKKKKHHNKAFLFPMRWVVPKANKTEVSKTHSFDFSGVFRWVKMHSPITASPHEG